MAVAAPVGAARAVETTSDSAKILPSEAAQKQTEGAAAVPNKKAEAKPSENSAPEEVIPSEGFYVRSQAYLVLRKWASARSRKLWVIPDNTVVRVLGRRKGTRWIRVQYQHRQGWIAWVKKRVVPVSSDFTLDDLTIVAR